MAQQAHPSPEYKTMQQDMERLKSNLKMSHSEFKIGTQIAAVGAAGLLMGLVLPPKIEEGMNANRRMKNTIMIVGGSVMSVGAIFMIDSHKFIGRAGN